MNQRQDFQQSQVQKLSQVQKMSQSQIQSLKILAMSNVDLRNEIFDFAAKNPALEVEDIANEESVFDDEFDNAIENRFDSLSDERYSSYTSANSNIASDEFMNALESNSDFRECLHDHLLKQLNASAISEIERKYCEKLIDNLDSKGFYILALDSIFKNQSDYFKDKCVKIVQSLDPIGVCCANFSESLRIQAQNIFDEGYVFEDDSDFIESLVFFLIEHFDFLEPFQISKITKKVNNFFDSQKILKFANESQEFSKIEKKATENDVKTAVAFLKTLNPFPASNFSTLQTNFISPEIKVLHIPSYDEEFPFKIEVNGELLPIVQIHKSFEDFIEKFSGKTKNMNENLKSELRFSKDSVQSAKEFIEGIEFRKKTLSLAARKIVEVQREFFLKGSRYLVPLTQKSFAQLLGVSDSTVSRLANEKYLSCDWGIFPLGYFFTNAVNSETVLNSFTMEFSGVDSIPTSKEGIKFEISKIIEEHKDDKKSLSDQKISDILAQRGVKVARRTVGKYRSELNINSSYSR